MTSRQLGNDTARLYDNYGENLLVSKSSPACVSSFDSRRTGATGYIGGEALHKIVKSKPDFQISCLVRDAGKGSMVKKAYPSVRIVKGDLDNTDLLEKEAKDADVVFRKSQSQLENEAISHGARSGKYWPSSKRKSNPQRPER